MGEIFFCFVPSFLPFCRRASGVEETSPRLFSIHKRGSTLCRSDGGEDGEMRRTNREAGKTSDWTPTRGNARAHFTRETKAVHFKLQGKEILLLCFSFFFFFFKLAHGEIKTDP